MSSEWILQGRTLSAADLAQIRAWRTEHPSWHRTRISRKLGTLWGWRNGVRQPKDMAGRSLLLKREARGRIELPARYGHPRHLVETFVESDRFAGTNHRAAGSVGVGATTGRGRNGSTPQGSLKDVCLLPLSADFRARLTA